MANKVPCIGDVVLTKMPNSPLWPALVVDPSESETASKMQGDVVVKFFKTGDYRKFKYSKLLPFADVRANKRNQQAFDEAIAYMHRSPERFAEELTRVKGRTLSPLRDYSPEIHNPNGSSTSHAEPQSPKKPPSPGKSMRGQPPFTIETGSTDSDDQASLGSARNDPTFLPSSDLDSSFELPLSGDRIDGILDRVLTRVSATVADSLDDENQPPTFERIKRKRSRHARPEQWNRNKRQKARLHGEDYISRGGKPVEARSPLPYTCKCGHKCSENFSREDREAICEAYYASGSIRSQREFIMRHMTAVDIQRRRPRAKDGAPTKARSTSFHYHFLHQETETNVCQGFFLATLGLHNDSQLRTARESMGPHGEHTIRPSREPVNKTAPQSVEMVKSHIRSFPITEAHYVRKNTQKQYLEPGLSIAGMFRLYEKWAVENIQPPARTVSFAIYSQIFHSHFNLGFFVPKKDRCLICEKPKLQSLSGQELQRYTEEILDPHICRKEDAHNEKNWDKKRAQRSRRYRSVTFDLQSVLYTPCSDVTVMFYKSKLCVYNLTVFEQAAVAPNTQSNAYCFLWDETLGKRGSSEIGSCLIRYIRQLPPYVRHISLYSDTCGGQNRNANITAMLLYEVNRSESWLQTIDHKFLESGHTHMECDGMHANIERAKKHQRVHTPEFWEPVIISARRPKPYEVTFMTRADIYNLSLLAASTVINRKKNTAGEKFEWLRTKWFRYRKGFPSTVFYKVNYCDVGFKELAVCGRKSRHAGLLQLSPAYPGPLPISSHKHKDLMDIVRAGVIPRHHAHFYESLAHEEKSERLPIPSFDEEEGSDSGEQ